MKVLLVEDETDLLSLVSEALDHHGVAVTEAESGGKALEVLSEGNQFDVLVSDIAMPGNLSGIDVAYKVLKAYPDMRIILTSGHPLSNFPALPKNTQFLPKPYRVKQLMDLINRPSAV